MRGHSADLPIFLLANRSLTATLPLEVSREIQEYVWLFEDTPTFIAGRVSFAVRRYEERLLPPFFRALVDFSTRCTPSCGRRTLCGYSTRRLAPCPNPVLPPGRAYQLLVRDQVEWVAVDDMGGRVTAVMVVPYPPGIPLLMPGENAGDGDGPVLGYLKALQDLDRKFPGFGHDIHGVQTEADGIYRIMCLKNTALMRL